MNFLEQVMSLIRASGSLEDLGHGLARVLDGNRLRGFVFFAARERCMVTVPYLDALASSRLRDRFESSEWRGRPREAFLGAFAALNIPTGEVGESIHWAFLGSEEDPLGAFACVFESTAPPPGEGERKTLDFFFHLVGELGRRLPRARPEGTREPGYLLAALNQVGRLMLEKRERPALLAGFLKTALDITRTEVGSIILLSQGRCTTEVEWGLPQDLLLGIRLLPEERGIVERIQETLEPVIIDDFSGPTVRVPADFAIQLSCLVSIPLLAQGRLIGILSVAGGGQGNDVLISAVATLATVGVLIAAAVEDSRLREALEARAEEAHHGLAEEQNLLRRVLENVEEGVLVSDAAGCIVIANPAAEKMLGLGSREGRRHPERNAVTLRPFFSWLRRRWMENLKREELEYGLAVEPPALLKLGIAPVRGSGGRSGHVTVIREAGQERGTGHGRADQLSRLACEVEVPLAALRAAWAAAQGEPLAETTTAGVVRRSFDRLAALSEDLREHALLDEGRLKLSRVEVQLPQVVTAALEACRQDREERRIACRLPEPCSGPPVLADPERLLQALVRLFRAAVSFTADEAWMQVQLGFTEGRWRMVLDCLLLSNAQDFQALLKHGAGMRRGMHEVPPGTVSVSLARRLLELQGVRLAFSLKDQEEGRLLLEIPAAAAGAAVEAAPSEQARGLEPAVPGVRRT